MHVGRARTIETVPFTIVACLALVLGALALVLDGAGGGEQPEEPALRAPPSARSSSWSSASVG